MSLPNLTRATGPPLSASETWLLGLVLITAFGLRFAFPFEAAVEHFDEGVYASNFWFLDAAQGGPGYPDRHLYAPPLLPALIEWCCILFGPSNFNALWLNMLAGGLTVAIIWWIGRRWFGPEAGLGAATLAALSDVQIVFSRSALTDVLLCAWLALAVYLLWESLTNGSYRYAAAAGVATGLAWWTKYNGWLPLAITLAGLLAAAIFDRQRVPPFTRALGCWLLAAVVATLVWLPYLWALQSHGGYAAVAANHRAYLGGWAAWPAAFSRQWANLRFLDGLQSCLSPLAAFCLVGLVSRRKRLQAIPGFTWNKLPQVADSAASPQLASPQCTGSPLTAADQVHSQTSWICGCLGGAGLLGAGLLCGSTATLAGLTGIALLCELRSTALPSPQSNPAPVSSTAGRWLAVWMLAAWFGGLLLVTPLYRPYARLTLPWIVASWLGAGLGVSKVFGSVAQRGCAGRGALGGLRIPLYRIPLYRWVVPAGVVAMLIAGLASGPRILARGAVGWQPRTGIKDVALAFLEEGGDLAGLIRQGLTDRIIVYVYAEPALLFQLRLAGLELVAPISHLRFADARVLPSRFPTFVAIGPHAERDPAFQRQFRDVEQNLTLVRPCDYFPSDLVLLDENHLARIPAPAGRQPEQVRLYRVK